MTAEKHVRSKQILTVVALLLIAISGVTGYVLRGMMAGNQGSLPMRDPTPRIGIVVAMPSEAKYVFDVFNKERSFAAYGFNFSVGTISGKPVVIVVSGIGEEASAAAVEAMAMLFNIKWVANIGTSGAHTEKLDTGDVVVAARIAPYGNRMYKSYTSWRYLKLGVLFPNMSRGKFLYINTSNSLIELTRKAAEQIHLPPTPADLIGRNRTYNPRVVLNGTIASADIWTANSTYIRRLHSELGTDAEEMEAYGVALTCYRLGLPFVKIAVISNNELTGSPWCGKSVEISMTNGVKFLQKMIELSP
ncbi:MAG: 5'-methylthioadenosine/S-adenosylhomocysteine nucleosidase [Desulfurococcales archaeon]|nr:5'-methylthioadenosine/S-adenosylhomocysteine nucleosidase [Desulfurococcales archaeon]